MFSRLLIAICVVSLSACISLPRYDNLLTGGVSPRDVAEAIECELVAGLPIWETAGASKTRIRKPTSAAAGPS